MSQLSIPDELCAAVFAPPRAHVRWSLSSLLVGQDSRYFSYGRYALYEALRIAKVAEGERVALPGFICRDVLSAVNAVGANPVYYPVGRNLNLEMAPASVPSAKAILAVNYFGFPQDLSPFQEYCRKTGAVLIEDNAHGLFSCDENGRWLGTRGDIGIFSLRKTIPVADGALLVIGANGQRFCLGSQEPLEPRADPLSFRLKQAARTIVPIVGHKVFYRLASLVRGARRITGNAGSGESRSSRPESETKLPSPSAPSKRLAEPFEIDISGEASRRRAIYQWLEMLLCASGIGNQPIFPILPSHVVPYGYPFYASQSELSLVRPILDAHGLSCLTWPDLPEAIRANCPVHYQNVRVVPFLW